MLRFLVELRNNVKELSTKLRVKNRKKERSRIYLASVFALTPNEWNKFI